MTIGGQVKVKELLERLQNTNFHNVLSMSPRANFCIDLCFFCNCGAHFLSDIVKVVNRCALKLEKATKASVAGIFACYLSPNLPQGTKI